MSKLIRPRIEPDSRSVEIKSDEALTSIAISLKRIADMMEESSKPTIELAPEGYVSDQEHRRIMREGLERDVLAQERIADALWGTDGTSGLLQLLNPLDIRNNY